MNLSSFECSVVSFIIEHEAPEISDHISRLSVSDRERTGVGIYVNFHYRTLPMSLHKVSKDTLGKGVFGSARNVPGGLGFMLYIDSGMISTLEIFCHGYESLPEDIVDFELYYRS